MGDPIAANLVRAGFPVTVWDRTPTRLDELVELGAHRAQAAAEAVPTADVVLTMLSDGDAVAQVMGARTERRGRPSWIRVDPDVDGRPVRNGWSSASSASSHS
jgi:3-hydroxyisobutyrate dehydrogenase-like beta-hydroxyacid dehydrogenase